MKKLFRIRVFRNRVIDEDLEFDAVLFFLDFNFVRDFRGITKCVTSNSNIS